MAFKTTFADPISIVKGSRVKMDESNTSFSDQRPSPWPLFETEAREISGMSYSIASIQLNHERRGG